MGIELKLKPLYMRLCSWAFGFYIGWYKSNVFLFGIYFIRWTVGFRITTERWWFDTPRVLNIGAIFGKDLLDD